MGPFAIQEAVADPDSHRVDLLTEPNPSHPAGFVRVASHEPQGDRFGPVIDAFTHHHAGLNDYDQAHWSDARGHFARALAIREELELDEADSSRAALAAAQQHLEGT